MVTPSQPPQPPKPRMIWVDSASRYWKVERLPNLRWSLSLYHPATEMWLWISDYSNRADAIQAAYEEPPQGM
jgi:hypothetical protein